MVDPVRSQLLQGKSYLQQIRTGRGLQRQIKNHCRHDYRHEMPWYATFISTLYNLPLPNVFDSTADIGADIVDVTNQESRKFGKFKLEDTWFELSPNQKIHFEEIQRVNSYFRDRYHALRDILWKAGYRNHFTEMPPR